MTDGYYSNRRARCLNKSPGQVQIHMNEKTKLRRKKLSMLSRVIKAQIEVGDIEAATINEGLIETYSKGEQLEFNTFHQWKKKNFQVKKGSEAFAVWGKPRKVPVPDSDKDDEFKFWPICYLFSQEQVQPIEDK